MPRVTGLSTKQLKYVNQRAKGLRKKDAALAAGYSEAVANAPVATIEKSPAVKAALESFQDTLRTKISDERIADKLSALMDAQRPDKAFGMIDDNQAQLKATELAMKAQRYLTSDKGDTNIQVNIQNVLD